MRPNKKQVQPKQHSVPKIHLLCKERGQGHGSNCSLLTPGCDFNSLKEACSEVGVGLCPSNKMRGEWPQTVQGGSGWLSEQCLLQRAARRWHSCPGVGSPRPWRCSELRGCGTEGGPVGTGRVGVSDSFSSLNGSVILIMSYTSHPKGEPAI